jgi:hypothetical protein
LDKEIRRIISRELKKGNPRQNHFIDNPGIGVRYGLSFALKQRDENYVENLQRVFIPSSLITVTKRLIHENRFYSFNIINII